MCKTEPDFEFRLMERALAAGEALADDFGVFVDEYGHLGALLLLDMLPN